MIVYLDLDRTLFRTHDSGRQILDKVGELFEGVDVAQAYADRDKYYQPLGDLYYHDMTDQLGNMGLDAAHVYKSLLRSELADGRFEIYGCGDLIRGLQAKGVEVKIFTFGPDDFQRFKVQLCPSLRDLEVITTLRPKHELLDIYEHECWLVDDKPIGHELPSNVSFVQVSLETNQKLPPNDWPIFYSLKDVKEFFDDVFA